MACEPTPGAPTAVRHTKTRSTSCGTTRSGSRPRGHGVPSWVMRWRPSPNWGRRTNGRRACRGRASSHSGWRRGWRGNSWTGSCTACMACTWRASPPTWLRAAGTRRATGTPCSWTSRGSGPATPFPGTTLSADTGHTGDTIRNQPRLRPGAPPGRRWPQDFVQDLVRWARALAWVPGLAEVSWAELALDYEAFAGWALPASPDHGLRGTRLPLGQRAQILCKAAGLVERHPAAGTLLCGAPLGRCRSLLPLGGRMCASLSARPFFAARHEVMLQLMRLATHCRVSWVRRLWAPARMRPPLSDRFLMDYYPRPLKPPPPPAICQEAPRAPPKSVPLATLQRSRPPGVGNGTQGALCLEHGAPSCPRYGGLGWGISRCCRVGHEGHTDPSAGPQCPRVPPRAAPGCQVLVPEDRRAGAAALTSWLGRARLASQALLASIPLASPRCMAPQDAGRSCSALGTDNSRPPKCPKLNLLADRGGSVSQGPAHPGGGGGADPFSPPPTAGDDNSGPVPAGAEVSSGSTRAPPAPRGSPPPLPRRANPPSPSAGGPPASLPDVFSCISAALNSRAAPRRRSPLRGRRRPQPKATMSVADMLRACPPPPPRATADDMRGGSSDPVADTPSAPSPS